MYIYTICIYIYIYIIPGSSQSSPGQLPGSSLAAPTHLRGCFDEGASKRMLRRGCFEEAASKSAASQSNSHIMV